MLNTLRSFGIETDIHVQADLHNIVLFDMADADGFNKENCIAQ